MMIIIIVIETVRQEKSVGCLALILQAANVEKAQMKKKRKKKEKVDGETCRNTSIPTTVSWCCCRFSSQRPFVVNTALFFCVNTGAHGAASLFFSPPPPLFSLSPSFFFLFFCTLCSGPCAKTFFFLVPQAARFTLYVFHCA